MAQCSCTLGVKGHSVLSLSKQVRGSGVKGLLLVHMMYNEVKKLTVKGYLVHVVQDKII